MAVQVEPPRWRPRSPEAARYPGLTPEERGYPPTIPPATDPGPPRETPLWLAPSELPPPARSAGLVVERPEPPPAASPDVDGLFDVPGLLERLWLARALEAAHRPPVPTGRTGPLAPASALGSATTAPAAPESPVGLSPTSVSRHEAELVHDASAGPDVVLSREPEPAPPSPPAAAWPASWICPYCYLANDPRAATCRGCRSGSLHL